MSVIEDVEKIIQPKLAEHGFDLVDAQYRKEAGNWVLRIFIDKLHPSEPARPVSAAPSKPARFGELPDGALKSGVTLADCEKVSDLVGAVLDASNALGSSYVLEVSSPGVNRALRKEADFERFIGQKVKISLFAPLSEQTHQRNFSGPLLSCRDQAIEVSDAVSGKIRIPISAIAKAHLDLI